MSVATTRGDHGQPIIEATPRTIADLQQVSDFAGLAGTRVIAASAAEMTTGFRDRFGFDPYDGLECHVLNDVTYRYNAGTGGWDPLGLARYTTGDAFTPSDGWSLTTASMRVGFDRIQVYASFTRSGTAITVPSDGNLSNITVGRLSISPSWDSGLGSGRAGRLSRFMADNNGYVQLVATTPGATIGISEALSFADSYPYR